MKDNPILQDLTLRYPKLDATLDSVIEAFDTIRYAFEQGGVLFACGNGGSAADCAHIVGELMKSFRRPRPINPIIADKLMQSGEIGEYLANTLEGALPCISLCEQDSLATAYINDNNAQTVFAQKLFGLGRKGDVLLCISTSGNSANCVAAATLAREMNIAVIALTGEGGGELAKLADVAICVPEKEVYKVQELHLPVYHAICALLEEHFWS